LNEYKWVKPSFVWWKSFNFLRFFLELTACKQQETVAEWLEEEEELELEEEVEHELEVDEEDDGTVEVDVADVDEVVLQFVINEWDDDSWIGDNLRLKSYGDWWHPNNNGLTHDEEDNDGDCGDRIEDDFRSNPIFSIQSIKQFIQFRLRFKYADNKYFETIVTYH